MAKVTSNFATDHFLIRDEAIAFARKWSELLTGKFTVWEDDGQGERVTAQYLNGRAVA